MQELYWNSKFFIKSILRQPRLLASKLKSWQRFWKSYYHYKDLSSLEEQPLIKYLYPCIGEDTTETQIEPIYFYQDTWAFEKIIKQQPKQHIDVGSHHKFVAFLSKIVPVTMVDIRPLSLPLNTLDFKEGSILQLPFEDCSVESLSSLCVVEHIGLGRYGDPLDPKGTEKAIAELKRVIKPSGTLYLSLPVHDQNITFFNAHRAFTEEYIELLVQPLEIVEKHYIYKNKLTSQKEPGFGVGLYQIKKTH
jgi:SAM-dependent methyltransferase